MPALPRQTIRLLVLTAIMLFSGFVLMASGFAILAHSHAASAQKPQARAESPVVTSAPEPTPRAVESTPATQTSTAAASAEPAIVAAPTEAAPPPAPSGPSVDAYRGLGMWVDIYDDSAFKDPAAAVADMSSHGVRTLYIETGNSRSEGDVFKPAQQKQFISAAHAHNMKIVAWYLPDLKDLAKDFKRVESAIDLTTADGQKFDSFALDIESSAVSSPSARNKALATLSQQIRGSVGPTYPLGAIIPSPVGLAKGNSWAGFPYTSLAALYDVFVPMSYYTYHGNGAQAAYEDTLGNVRILRAQPGCSAIPIHLIGGVAEDSSAAELGQFVRAANETRCLGASFYSWPGTKAAHWAELKAVSAGTP